MWEKYLENELITTVALLARLLFSPPFVLFPFWPHRIEPLRLRFGWKSKFFIFLMYYKTLRYIFNHSGVGLEPVCKSDKIFALGLSDRPKRSRRLFQVDGSPISILSRSWASWPKRLTTSVPGFLQRSLGTHFEVAYWLMWSQPFLRTYPYIKTFNYFNPNAVGMNWWI